MNTLSKQLTIGVASILCTAALAFSSVAAQTPGVRTFQANLNALNSSGDNGTATVRVVDNNTVTVTVNTNGATPGLPHAQHLHIGGQNICPDPSASGEDDLITTPEGKPFYGEIEVSLTTSGDVGEGSALAVDRFPVANEQGVINYERTFDLPEGTTTDELEKAVVVQHGVGELFDDKSKYDGDMKSPLTDTLPLEATIPASCGALTAAPIGGAGTGAGSTAGIENSSAIALGVVAVVTGMGLIAVSRRKSNNQ